MPVVAVLLVLSPTTATAVTTRGVHPHIARIRGGAARTTLLPAAAAGLLFAATPAQAAAATPALVNCVAGASGFFGNVRVPAALLAGASLGQLFTKCDETRGKWVPSAYAILMALTVVAEVYVVFVATAQATRLLGGGFDPMATDALDFLIREFEFAFVSTRAGFFTGLLAFLSALMLRAWSAFPGALGSCIACAMLSVTLQMLAFFNATVLNYPFGLLGLVGRTMFLYLTMALYSPIGLASLGSAVAASVLLVKVAKEKLKDE